MKVTVFGSARLGESTSEYRDAVRLGRKLAGAGHTVMSGGYGGLMEAVSRGAHEAGGDVIGITMAAWVSRLKANQYVSQERAAKTLFARIQDLIEADCLVALSGGAGTLGEVALAWNLQQMDLMPKTPVILVGPVWEAMLDAFRSHLVVNDRDLAMLTWVSSVDDVMAKLESPMTSGGWRG